MTDDSDDPITMTCRACGAVIEGDTFEEAYERANEHGTYCPGRV